MANHFSTHYLTLVGGPAAAYQALPYQVAAQAAAHQAAAYQAGAEAWALQALAYQRMAQAVYHQAQAAYAAHAAAVLASAPYLPAGSSLSSLAPFSQGLNALLGGDTDLTYSAEQGLRQLCGLSSNATLVDALFSLGGEQNHCINSAVRSLWNGK